MAPINISTSHPSKFRLVFPFLDFLSSNEKGDSFLLYCSEVSLPGITNTPGKIGTPYLDLHDPDGVVTFGNTVVATYAIDEKFENFKMLYSWMKYIRDPERFGVQRTNVTAALHIYTNNDNPTFKFTLKNISPISLGDLFFSTKNLDNKDLEHKVTFAIEYYTIEDD